MNKIRYILYFFIVFTLVIFLTSCEELFSNISGLVTNDGIPVKDAIVTALNADEEAYGRLSEINELSANALSAITDVVKGFDIASDDNGNYSATLLSGGTITVYVVAIKDDGNENLDSLDLVGWYGNIEEITIPNPYTGIDSITVVYTDPLTLTLKNGADTTGIDISHMIYYWLLLEIQQYVD